ncbi:MAG: hypothetical protein ACD_84C00005G0002 [uncultured bacterium]|nr:MAG: hypothetical protein ACD_84C00005G0002 [uncultured bacterium]
MIDPAMPGPFNQNWEVQLKAVKKELKARQKYALVKRINLIAIMCFLFGVMPRLVGIVETHTEYVIIMRILDLIVTTLVFISALYLLIKNNQK